MLSAFNNYFTIVGEELVSTITDSGNYKYIMSDKIN